MYQVFDKEVYTSNLTVFSNEKRFTYVDDILKNLDLDIACVNKFNYGDHINFYNPYVINFMHKLSILEDIPMEVIKKFVTYNSPEIDFTGLLKGYGISYINYKMIKLGSKSHYIDWGGDILFYNCDERDNFVVEIKNKKEFILIDGSAVIFTSGNDNPKRGHHIFNKDHTELNGSVTVKSRYLLPITADILATCEVADTPLLDYKCIRKFDIIK